MDLPELPFLGLDEDTLVFIQSAHRLKASGSSMAGYEKLRDELFAQRNRVSIHFLTLAEVIAATTDRELPDNDAWQDFRLIVDAEYALESPRNVLGRKRKRSRDE